MEFIEAKEKPRALENFNISVAATDGFMRSARQGGEIDLVNPAAASPLAGLAQKS